MRLKKGFTLAELLTVLTIIGVIAALTVPTVSKKVVEAQMKSSFKKGYNTVASIISAGIMQDKIPKIGGEYQVKTLYYLSNSLAVNGFDLSELNFAAVKDGLGTVRAPGQYQGRVWIVAQDGLAYTVLTDGANNSNSGSNESEKICAKVDDIFNKQSTKDAYNSTCAAVIVDVNGLTKGPNLTYSGNNEIDDLDKKGLLGLNTDRFYIFIGQDGVTPGNPDYILGAKILEE